MKNSIVATGLMAAAALAAPVVKKDNIDATVLQFALTLEHLENTFYKQALQKFSQADFEAAGFTATYYNNLMEIAYDEQSHVEVLTSALTAAGAMPVAPCTYNFGYTDVRSFVTLSSIVENVGTSAYLGGAPLITSKDYLTVAGSILVTEALHTSYQRAWVGEVPFATPYGTPLDPTSVYSIVTPFFVSCPSTNMALPFTAFPALSAAKSSCSSSDTNTFTSTSSIPSGSFLTYVAGLEVISEAGTVDGMSISSTVPMGIAGQSYVFVTSANVTGAFDDTKVVAGPAIIEVAVPAPVIDYSEY